MTFQQFAFNNVRRNKRQYGAYFFSSTFAVSVFFMYAALIFHPAVHDKEMNPIILKGIVAAEFVIFTFSFLFVLYSFSTFLKTRKKEFALLTIMGITKIQLNRLLAAENFVMGILSIALGIGFGMLSSKFFFMLLSILMDLKSPISFYISSKAVTLTTLSFAGLFVAVTILTMFAVRSQEVLKMLQDAKRPKTYPRSSIWIGILAITAIAIGYSLSATANLFEMLRRMLPILGLVSIGTYFLYSQSSIVLIRLLKKQKDIYFHSINMLTVSDLAYKLKDNARILFIVTILSAVALTSSGVLLSVYSGSKNEVETRAPQTISLSTSEYSDQFKKNGKQIEEYLNSYDIPFEAVHIGSVKALYPDMNNKQIAGSIISENDYNDIAQISKKETIRLQKNEAMYVSSVPDEDFLRVKEGDIEIQANNLKKNYQLTIMKKPITSPSEVLAPFIVVSNDEFKTISKGLSMKDFQYYYGYSIPNWNRYNEEIMKLHDHIHLKDGMDFDTNALRFQETKQTSALFFFIGIFISCLFFFAAASALYFRLYNDLDKEVQHYQSLNRIGLTIKEMNKIVSLQLAIMFFIPFGLAVLHSTFAFLALRNMIAGSVLMSSTTIIMIFLFLQVIYFIFIRGLYLKKLQPAIL